MTISLRGIGWLTNREYGCVRMGLRHAYEEGEGIGALQKKGIFSYPVKNFGRFDGISRTTCYAVALALKDAGIVYSSSKKQDIGIIGMNSAGSLKSDIEYFNDYLKSGRTLSRGNLFIYTLPSSPLGEAAIHFGFLGPLLYVADEESSIALLLDAAEEMILSEEAPVMLAGRAEEDEAVFFVLDGNPDNGQDILCDLAGARSIVESNPGVSSLTRKFTLFGKKKGPA